MQDYVLLIKTESLFTQQISRDLADNGYGAIAVGDIPKAWQQFERREPMMILFHGVLTGAAGLDFCRQVREGGYRQPVLMVLANATLEDRITCLEAGADDYLLEPYRSDQFLQLVQLYLKPQSHSAEQLRYSDLVLDLHLRKVMRQGREIDLTIKEFELLKYLMNHPQQVLTREQILDNVWGKDFQGESNVIEVYIRYLRLKIENEGQRRLIQTVRGVGYVLREV